MPKDENRRKSDPLLKDLIDEVRNHQKSLEDQLGPIREFMEQVNVAKKAAIWIVAIFAAIGAAIKWCLDMKDYFPHKGP